MNVANIAARLARLKQIIKLFSRIAGLLNFLAIVKSQLGKAEMVEAKMNTETALLVHVDVEKVGDTFSASSADVPGLHVCGDTLEGTTKSVMNAIKVLFKYNRELDVEVMPVADDADAFRNGKTNHRQFIVRHSHA